MLSDETYGAFETATALDACGQALTLSSSFLASVRPPRPAPPPPAAPIAASTNPTLRLALPYVSLVLEADPKDTTGMVALTFVTTVKPGAEPACAIKLLRDAEPIELGPLDHHAAEAAHEYRTKLGFSTLEQLAAAQRVVGKVCEQRFALGTQHITQLRDFLLRVREERQLAN